jgi:parallel beta-helix repeat protein
MKKLLILTMVLSALLIAVPVSAAPVIRVVDDDGTYDAATNGCDGTDPAYTTIQAVVTAAAAGDTIIVCPGTYAENISVSKSLTLQGAPGAIIDGGAGGDAINVSANGVTIEGFEIRNGYNGIAGQSSNSTFSNNVIHDNLNIPGYAGLGILLWGDNDDNSIVNNTIYNNDRQGIFIGYYDTSRISERNLISGNTVYNNGLYTYANGPDASAYGIQLWKADNNTIEGNEIYNHDDWFPYGDDFDFAQGVDLCGAYDNTLTLNNLHDFDFAQGVYLCGAYDNTLTLNNLHDNNYGVGVWSCCRASAATNTANLNNIAGNTAYGVRTFGAVTMNAENNWWGSPTGPCRQLPNGKWAGHGDKVSANVAFAPWLPRPIESWPQLPRAR